MLQSLLKSLSACVFAAILAFCSASTSSRPDLSAASWILAGPFENPQDARLSCPGFYRDSLTELGGEANATLAKGATVGGRRVIEAKAVSGAIDFKTYISPSDSVVAYAYTELDSSGGEYALRLGSDDGIRAWLNGRMVVDHHVHRSLNPDDEAIPLRLVKGKNRLLVKVDQGGGSWSFACRLVTRAEEEKAFAKVQRAELSIVQAGRPIAASGDIEFSVRTFPQYAVGIPVRCALYDSTGTEISKVGGITSETITLAVPPGAQGVFSVVASPAADAFPQYAKKLSKAEAVAYFLRGEEEKIFGEAAAKARGAAKALDPARDRYDLGPTLEFLADRLEGKLHPSLEADALKTKAVGFAFDIMGRIASGAGGPLTGYRQYAYRSSIDGSLQPYSLYVPRGFDLSRRYGLVVTLHGYGGDDDSGGEYLANLRPEDFIIASPYGRGDLAFRTVGEQDVIDVMDRVMAGYPVDPDRVYLSGNSMGGLGTWTIGQLYPDRFAAIVPFCGWTGTDLLPNLRNLAVFAVHGDSDPTVPVDMDRAAVKELKKLGFTVRYDEIPGGDHSAWGGWVRTHTPSSIFDYLRAHTRNPSPKRITAKVPYPRYGRQYWIRVDELVGPDAAAGMDAVATAAGEGPAPGILDAERDSNVSLRITTDRISALTVDFTMAGLDASRQRTIVIEGTKIAAPPGISTVSLVKNGGAWRIDDKTPRGGVARHPGGGMADVFSNNLLLVYGTLVADRKPELALAAKRLADWSPTADVPVGMKTGGFALAPDTAVTQETLRSRNILLIGTEKENRVTRLFTDAIRPYYAGGVVSVGGTRFTDLGLGLTFPNPLAPANLVGYIDLPRSVHSDPEVIEAWFAFFSLRFRGYQVNETASYPGYSPDVMVLTRNPLIDVWSGWFDRNWENLSGR
jgi:predicted esterase